jgi:hypothetical protein
MNRWTLNLGTLIIAMLLMVGCSNSGTALTPNPVENPEITIGSTNFRQSTGNNYLLAYHDIYFDIESGTFEAVENRTAAFTLNIVPFLNKMTVPKYGITFGSVVIHNDDPAFLGVDVEFTVHHPFPGYDQYQAYDLRGVIIGDGADTMVYGDLNTARHGADLWMKNPDGYTRWFNPTDFTSEMIFGYVPGGYQNYAGNAQLNPYKYYSKHLQKDQNLWSYLTQNENFSGLFESGSGRTMELEFPLPPGGMGIKFGYAVVVAWEDQGPTGPFYPYHVPEAIAASVTQTPDVWFDGVDSGGDLILDIDLFGWDYQPSTIKIESTLLDSIAEFDAAAIGEPVSEHVSTYHVEVEAAILNSTEGHFCWVITEYEGFGYSNDFPGAPHPDAPLAAFFRYDIEVLDESPYVPPSIIVMVPDGGEVWTIGEEYAIEWTAPPEVTDVKLEYSKDGFSSDIIEIEASIPNTGSYLWSVPNDPTDTARIRVSEVGNSYNFDVSNGDFIIEQAACTPVFTEKWTYDIPGNGSVDSFLRGGFTLADLENDGYVETLVLAGVTSILYCFDHLGNIKWEFDCGTPVSDWYASPAVGEFTGDDILDVVICNDDMSGPFANYLYVVDGSDGTEVYHITCGDIFNGAPSLGDVVGATNSDPPDGQLDIFAPRYDNPERFITCYNGIDGSIAWESRASYVMSTPALADMDLDGDLDCVAAGGYYDLAPGSNGINVLRGEANASDRLIWEADHGSLIFVPSSLHDFTGDNIPDVIVSDYSGHNVECLDGSDGSVLWNYGGLYSHVGNPALGDLNSDGYPDVVTTSTVIVNPTKIIALSGDPNATERVLWSFHDPDYNMDPRGGVVLCDVTCDGIPDVIAGTSGWNTTDVWGKLWIIDGETGEEIAFYQTDGDQILFGTPAVGDIDNDGETDLVFGTHDSATVYAFGLGTPWPDNYDARPWPMRSGNIRNTGLYGDEF